jgi:hypothetical protein
MYKCNKEPIITSDIGGRPGTITTLLLGRISASEDASVWFGLAAPIPPHDEQLPKAKIAFAPFAAWIISSRTDLPPTVRYSSFSGILPQ